VEQRKQKKESKKKEHNSRLLKTNRPEQERPDEKADRPDYGGFPDRDLKKNLGCG
jgi:hypothetical protein